MRPSKYGANRLDRNGNPHGYASRKEAKCAADLKLLEQAGKISGLREQVKFELVPGKNGVSGIYYVADFVYEEDQQPVILDTKGFRTQEYKLKKKMLYLLCGLTITEV